PRRLRFDRKPEPPADPIRRDRGTGDERADDTDPDHHRRRLPASRSEATDAGRTNSFVHDVPLRIARMSTVVTGGTTLHRRQAFRKRRHSAEEFTEWQR